MSPAAKHLGAFIVGSLFASVSANASAAPTAASAASTPALAERFPPPRIGARFAYVDGVFKLRCNRWVVHDVSASGDITSRCGASSLTVTADGNPVAALDEQGDVVARFAPFLPQLSFPLQVGKKWSGHYDGQEGRFKHWSGDMACEAAAFEPVRIAAGSFDAFRIECVTQVRVLFLHQVVKSTNWYAPAAGMIVKSVNDDSGWDMELAGEDGG